MKLPLVLTCIILAAGLFWGVHETRVLTELREKHRLVVREAAALGVSADPSKSPAPTKAAKRQREDHNRKARDFSNKLVAFAREMKDMEQSGKPTDADMRKRIMETVDGMLSLNAGELKILIADLRGRGELDEEMRKNLIGFSIMMLAQQHPQTALAIFTESSDLLDKDFMSAHVLSSALSQWAKDQPLAALDWIKKNAGKHPDLVKDEAKLAVITGAAQTDFALAFQLAGELELSADKGSMLGRMIDTANTPGRQSEFLAALRRQAANTTDKRQAEKLMQSGLGSLVSKVAESGYGKTMEWLASANLNAAETADVAGHLSYHSTKADTGKWLDWMNSQEMDSRRTRTNAGNLVREWTRNDYKAAGEWLAKSPAGPLKETATMAYLETVAPYDPGAAEQWADTLTAEGRTKAVGSIHQALKQKDEAAAAEFARRHGIGGE